MCWAWKAGFAGYTSKRWFLSDNLFGSRIKLFGLSLLGLDWQPQQTTNEVKIAPHIVLHRPGGRGSLQIYESLKSNF